jgi:inorganic triphosphatase YgiF
MMPLFKSILEKIGVRLDKHEAAIEELKRHLVDTTNRVDEYGGRIEKIEDALEKVVAGFEESYASLAQRAVKAREQRKKDLQALRREIDIFIQIVELSAEAQMDETRRRRVAKLLKNARTKRTRLSNLLGPNVANDAA